MLRAEGSYSSRVAPHQVFVFQAALQRWVTTRNIPGEYDFATARKESTSVSDFPTALSETSVQTQRRVKAEDAFVTNKRALACGGGVLLASPQHVAVVVETALAIAHATADESKGIIELHEVNVSELLKSVDVLADRCPPCAGRSREQIAGESEVPQLAEVGGAAETAAHATAGDSEGIIGLRVSQSSFRIPINSLNSSGCVDAVACARVPAVPGVSATASSLAFPPASLAVVAHARSTPVHVAHNSWSDTDRGKGPTGRRSSKGGVVGPAEDLRPVPEVEAGVNFRPAGGARGQVAGSLPRKQPGTGTRRQRVGVDTPSLHLEVPDLQFVSPGHGLEIRQSMGWTKVCGTTQQGIWVLKVNARTYIPCQS